MLSKVCNISPILSFGKYLGRHCHVYLMIPLTLVELSSDILRLLAPAVVAERRGFCSTLKVGTEAQRCSLNGMEDWKTATT